MPAKKSTPPPRIEFAELNLPVHPISGTADDHDDRDDEHAGENEAAIGEIDENTEAPEEFDGDVDNEDEDDDADAAY